MEAIENNSLTDAYDTYLAELISEIEEAGVPTIIPPGKRLIRLAGSKEDSVANSLTLPPTPKIFEQLPDDALTNIRWGVKIYHDYLKPLGTEGLNRRANVLYEMAQESAKNQGEDEKSGRVVEKHLTMTMLANRREALQENAHLNFYLLMLMQVGILRRILKHKTEKDITALNYEIDRSRERGAREYSEQIAALEMYEIRGEEEAERHKSNSGLGGSKNFEANYKAAKDYALRRYSELSAAYENAGKKRYKKEIAQIVHAELKKECGTTINADCPDYRVLYERWLPKKAKQKTHATN